MNVRRLEQITLEDKYSRHDIRAKVMKDISSGLEIPLKRAKRAIKRLVDESYYDSKNKRLEWLTGACELDLDEILQEICVLTLRTDKSQSFQAIVGGLACAIKHPDIWEGIRLASDLIAVVCTSDLYDIIPAKNSDTGSLVVIAKYQIEESTRHSIEQMKYLPPMICPPELVHTNGMSGYLTKNDSVILGVGNHHNSPLALTAINIANSTKLCLDLDMVEEVELSTKELGRRAQQNFDYMANSSTEVYKDILEQGNEFWFNWKFDKRGRMYSQGYHINIQGTEYKKSIINLAKKEVITL